MPWPNTTQSDMDIGITTILPPAVEPVSLALDDNGRLLVLDRAAGRLIVVELVYGACE